MSRNDQLSIVSVLLHSNLDSMPMPMLELLHLSVDQDSVISSMEEEADQVDRVDNKEVISLNLSLELSVEVEDQLDRVNRNTLEKI